MTTVDIQELECSARVVGKMPNTAAEFAAVLLVESAGLTPTKDVPADRSYIASLKHLALCRLRAALTTYQISDGAAIASCADTVETHRYLPPMMRLHLAPALRAVAHGELAPFVVAELVSACIAAEARDDVREYFAEIASAGLNEVAGAIEAMAEAVDEVH